MDSERPICFINHPIQKCRVLIIGKGGLGKYMSYPFSIRMNIILPDAIRLVAYLLHEICCDLKIYLANAAVYGKRSRRKKDQGNKPNYAT